MTDASLFGAAAALGSGFAWALGSILFRNIGQRASPSATNLAKSMLGLVLLGLVALIWGASVPDLRSAVWLVASGLLGIAVGDTLFFAALVRLEPRVTLLLASVGHGLTVILAALLLGERPGPATWAGIVLLLGAVGYVLQTTAEAAGSHSDAAGASRSSGSERRLGILYGVGSAVATSTALLLAKVGVEDVPALEGTWIRLAAGTVGVLAWTAVRGELATNVKSFGQPGLLREIAGGVAVVMFGGFWLSIVSLKYTDASIATALAATEPIFVLPLARWCLGERISTGAAVAAVVAVAGVGLIISGG